MGPKTSLNLPYGLAFSHSHWLGCHLQFQLQTTFDLPLGQCSPIVLTAPITRNRAPPSVHIPTAPCQNKIGRGAHCTNVVPNWGVKSDAAMVINSFAWKLTLISYLQHSLIFFEQKVVPN